MGVSLETFATARLGRDHSSYFLKYLRHFLHWKRVSERSFRGKLQNGHVSRLASFSSELVNISVLRPNDIRPIEMRCLLE